MDARGSRARPEARARARVAADARRRASRDAREPARRERGNRAARRPRRRLLGLRAGDEARVRADLDATVERRNAEAAPADTRPPYRTAPRGGACDGAEVLVPRAAGHSCAAR